MPDYIANHPFKYGTKTYSANQIVPVRPKDVRLLLSVGHISEARRDDRVAGYKPPPPGPTVAEHMKEHHEHMEQAALTPATESVEIHQPEPVVEAQPEPKFEIENAPIPEDITEKEPPRRSRRYNTTQMKADEGE